MSNSTPVDPSVQSLVVAVFEAGQMDLDALLAQFADHVAADYDERAFAERFDVVHKLFHKWMEM